MKRERTTVTADVVFSTISPARTLAHYTTRVYRRHISFFQLPPYINLLYFLIRDILLIGRDAMHQTWICPGVPGHMATLHWVFSEHATQVVMVVPLNILM